VLYPSGNAMDHFYATEREEMDGENQRNATS
jgi:hypothetical protein